MTFAAYEESIEAGRPVELYEFAVGDDRYRYTSDAADVTIAATTTTYYAVPISRGGISVSRDEQGGDRVEIDLPADDPFPARYVASVPGAKASMTLLRFHRNDPDQQTIVIFKGTVATVKFTDDATRAKLTIIPVTAAQSRPIPRLTYQGLCNHMLYDARCGVNETDTAWRKTLTVTAASANTVTVPGAGAFGSDFFHGGFIRCGNDFRLITAQSGDDLLLMSPFATSPVGKIALLNAGCKHRVTDCDAKFGNIANFGGFPFVPLKNPFESGL